MLSVLFITYVLFLCRVELKLVDHCNEGINTERKTGEPEICAGSAGVAFGLKTGMVNDDTAYPIEEENKKETLNFHNINSFFNLVYAILILF